MAVKEKATLADVFDMDELDLALPFDNDCLLTVALGSTLILHSEVNKDVKEYGSKRNYTRVMNGPQTTIREGETADQTERRPNPPYNVDFSGRGAHIRKETGPLVSWNNLASKWIDLTDSTLPDICRRTMQSRSSGALRDCTCLCAFPTIFGYSSTPVPCNWLHCYAQTWRAITEMGSCGEFGAGLNGDELGMGVVETSYI
ncbi:hypothetical protein PLICRDRAFT_26322 [Plicaturopsis crispa FD-325 SS-3]|nr:hypothetical protein PLICRDRAFT_26322 [Plicaturopsis crispa FD-325 SS-3]